MPLYFSCEWEFAEIVKHTSRQVNDLILMIGDL
jgi:hypothetical protein